MPAAPEPDPSPVHQSQHLPPSRATVPEARPRIDFVELDLVRRAPPVKRASRRTAPRDAGTPPAAPASAPAPAVARDPALGFWAEEA
jgi:hypothetical protein